MAEGPSKTAVRAWARLMRAQHAALARVEGALKSAELPPLVWYDVLLELSRAPRRGLRPFEIERNTLLPQYGLSRLLDRMERAGCVRRTPCKEDGRGQLVVITAAGKDLLRRMWPTYGAAIQEVLGGSLTVRELALLDGLLGKLGGAPEP